MFSTFVYSIYVYFSLIYSNFMLFLNTQKDDACIKEVQPFSLRICTYTLYYFYVHTYTFRGDHFKTLHTLHMYIDDIMCF